MSYVYDKVKEALGGSNFKSGTVNSKWSPNEVRAIYIMRDFIMVADYLKQPKVIPLDVGEVSKDLNNPSRRGFINNLLSDRQLSCMEEIYVDTVYSQYKTLIDLESYIWGIVSGVSRLRYYGYIQGVSKEELWSAYSRVFLNSTFDFSLGSLNIRGICSTGNDIWYKKFNLRPNYYALDGEKGKLNVYFIKCKNYIEGIEVSKAESEKFKKDFETVIKLFQNDVNYIEDILLLNKFNSFLKGKDSINELMSKVIEYAFGTENTDIKVKGISKDLVKKAVVTAKVPQNSVNACVIKFYGKLGVYDDSEKIELKDMYVGDGLIQLGKRLDNALSHYAKSFINGKNHKYKTFMTCVTVGLPNCKFNDTLKELGLTSKVVGKSVVEGLLDFVFGECGYTKADFLRYVTNGANKKEE